MQDETMRFAHERFTKELDAVAQIVRRTNPNDALVVQAEVANTMAEDCIAEGEDLIEHMRDMAKELSSNPKSDRAHH
jgi:hypothetical protein